MDAVSSAVSNAAAALSSNMATNMADNTDAELARQLNDLSFTDRNALLEEIHGVRCLAVEETPELLEASLKEFQKRIDAIDNSQNGPKRVYNKIVAFCEKEERLHNKRNNESVNEGKSSTYVPNHYALHSKDFRLRFLRTDLFDVSRAVDRFLSYLNLNYEFWGDIILERPIHLRDIFQRKEEKALLKKGYYQILPFRDRSGRKVIVDLGPLLQKRSDIMTFCRIMLYIYDSTTRNCVETQQRGVVTIFETHAWETLSFPRDTIVMANRVLNAIPVRFATIHMCTRESSPLAKLARNLLCNVLNVMSQRLRLITTFGSAVECRYRLKSFGIPIELYPLTPTGNIKLNHYNQWMKLRTILEDHEEKLRRHPKGITSKGDKSEHHKDNSTTISLASKKKPTKSRGKQRFEFIEYENAGDIVECPGLNDVVFRQGTSSEENPGNAVFRQWIMDQKKEEQQKQKDELRQQQKKKKQENTPQQLPQEQQKEEQELKQQELPPIEASLDDTNATSTRSDAIESFQKEEALRRSQDDAPSELPSGSPAPWEVDRKFCNALIREVEVVRKGRFLVWDRSISAWVLARTNTEEGLLRIRQKIMIAIYNGRKKCALLQETQAKFEEQQKQQMLRKIQQQQKKKHESSSSHQPSGSTSDGSSSVKRNIGGSYDSDEQMYQFCEGRRDSFGTQGSWCGGRGGTGLAGTKRRKNSYDSFSSLEI